MKTILKKYGILAIMSVLAVVLSFTACQQATGGTGKKMSTEKLKEVSKVLMEPTATDISGNSEYDSLKGVAFGYSVTFDKTYAKAKFLELRSGVPYTLKDKTVTFDFSAVKKVYADTEPESLVWIQVNGDVYDLESNLENMSPDKKKSASEIITKYKDKITSKEQAIAFLEAKTKLDSHPSSGISSEEGYSSGVQMNTLLKPKVAEWLAGSTNIIATLSDDGNKLTFTSLLVFGRQNGYEIKSNYEVAKGQGGGQ